MLILYINEQDCQTNGFKALYNSRMVVNNVTRFLDANDIKYQAFETPAEKLGAEETARLLDVPEAWVFKTIVVLRDHGKPILALVSASAEVDLKKLAAVLKEKKVHLASQLQAEVQTGLLTGGISPLALINKGFQVIIDESAQGFNRIHVSGGQRGLNIAINAKDLARLTKARFAPIAKPIN